MQEIANAEFRGRYDRGRGFHRDLCFRNCEFVSCGFSLTKAPVERSIARNLEFHRCSCTGSFFGPGIVEDTIVEHLDTGGLRIMRGTVFKHVVLRGKIGRIMTVPTIDTFPEKYPREQAELVRLNAQYYRNVDWALDISDAEFMEADLAGVPGRLIRRDPETQVLLTAERARGVDLGTVGAAGTWVQAAVQRIFDHGLPDIVLVAPKRAKDFRDSLRLLQLLRRSGVAESD